MGSPRISVPQAEDGSFGGVITCLCDEDSAEAFLYGQVATLAMEIRLLSVCVEVYLILLYGQDADLCRLLPRGYINLCECLLLPHVFLLLHLD